MSNTLSRMQDNFLEISSVINIAPTEDPYKSLVPNICSTRLYNVAYGWGRLWCLFYNIIYCFSGDNYRLKKLDLVIKRTQKAYHNCLPKIEECVNKYHNYIDICCKRKYFQEESLHTIRKAISNWNDATFSFLQLIQTNNSQALKFLFQHLENSGKPTFSTQLVPQTVQCQYIIDLEGALGAPLPLAALSLLSQEGVEIPNSDLKKIASWIQLLDKHLVASDLQLLHSALVSIVTRITGPEASQNEIIEGVARIEHMLYTPSPELACYSSGCQLFSQKEPEHMMWRSTLASGQSITCNENLITLGKPLTDPAEPNCAQNLLFEVINDPDNVLLVGINPCAAHIQQQLSKNYQFAIPAVEFQEVDIQGKCARIERLYPLTSLPEPEHYLPQFLNLLKMLIPQIDKLASFTPQNVMLNRSKQLRMNIETLTKEFSSVNLEEKLTFNALEEFVFYVAQGNEKLFIRLMQESGLYKHPIANFYHTLVQRTLKGEVVNVSELAQIRGISNVKIAERGEQLCKEIDSLRKQCYQELRDQHHLPVHPGIEEAISVRLQRYYNKMHTAGILWPTLAKEVMSRLLIQMREMEII